MQVFIINAFLLIEFIRLFVEFIHLFSINALILHKSSAFMLSINGLALTNDGKFTEPFALVSTSQLPQNHQFQGIGPCAILKGSTLQRCI
ncbi:hypothetical protein NIES30_06940 [Phormidium tenue NIES-30]|uniref:Uncharacterized protein n=1 Tax=Phormidium tenue NIES-30 TaxID=549789 RepID=A0A1U7J8B8_9CYAN|nr:hypothetical protein NIES30_06940 [Phormidium tenue NIES-30]